MGSSRPFAKAYKQFREGTSLPWRYFKSAKIKHYQSKRKRKKKKKKEGRPIAGKKLI